MERCTKSFSYKLQRALKIYTERDHAPKEQWVNHLVYPVRAYWGDGTSNWHNWEKNFEFYILNIFRGFAIINIY